MSEQQPERSVAAAEDAATQQEYPGTAADALARGQESYESTRQRQVDEGEVDPRAGEGGSGPL